MATPTKLNSDLVEGLRRQLEALGNTAVRTLAELLDTSDSDAVRLRAAEVTFKLIGVEPPKEAIEDKAEVERVDEDTQSTLERLQRNLAQREQPVLPGAPSLEALVVLEGDEEELPVGGTRPGAQVIEVQVHQG